MIGGRSCRPVGHVTGSGDHVRKSGLQTVSLCSAGLGRAQGAHDGQRGHSCALPTKAAGGQRPQAVSDKAPQRPAGRCCQRRHWPRLWLARSPAPSSSSASHCPESMRSTSMSGHRQSPAAGPQDDQIRCVTTRARRSRRCPESGGHMHAGRSKRRSRLVMSALGRKQVLPADYDARTLVRETVAHARRTASSVARHTGRGITECLVLVSLASLCSPHSYHHDLRTRAIRDR